MPAARASRLVLAGVFAGLALVLTVAAYYQPVPVRPDLSPQPCPYANPSGCAAWSQEQSRLMAKALNAFQNAMTPVRTLREFAITAWVLAGLSTAWFAAARIRVPGFLKRPLPIPRAVRGGAAVILAGALFVFALAVAFDYSNYNKYVPPFYTIPGLGIGVYQAASSLATALGLGFMAGMWDAQMAAFAGDPAFGTFAFGVYALAVGAFFAFRLGKGAWTAVKDTATFASAVVLAFLLGVWLLIPGVMQYQAANFAAGWKLWGVNVASNWLVLSLAAYVIGARVAASLASRSKARPGPRAATESGAMPGGLRPQTPPTQSWKRHPAPG